MFMRQLQISKYGKLIFLLVDGCNIAVRNSKFSAVLLTKLPCVSINPVWVWVDTICPILTINARQAHQIDDTPRAHAATNQRGMWSHTLTLQCKHCKTAQLLNSLSKHIGSKNSWANFSNKTHYTVHNKGNIISVWSMEGIKEMRKHEYLLCQTLFQTLVPKRKRRR
jgi:hypothetical protein